MRNIGICNSGHACSRPCRRRIGLMTCWMYGEAPSSSIRPRARQRRLPWSFANPNIGSTHQERDQMFPVPSSDRHKVSSVIENNEPSDPALTAESGQIFLLPSRTFQVPSGATAPLLPGIEIPYIILRDAALPPLLILTLLEILEFMILEFIS